MNRLVVIASAVLAAALVGAGAAWAASLLITPQKLTVFSTCIVRTASADSYVAQNSAGSNFGTSTSLFVRSQNASRNRRTFVRFDLSSCNAGPTAVVTTATLSLYIATAPNASRMYDVAPVTGSWTETGITWSNQPAVGAVSSSAATGTTSGVSLAWPVTSDVQAWLAGTATNAGFRVSDAIEGSTPAREAGFRPREWGTPSQRPKLTIMYYAR